MSGSLFVRHGHLAHEVFHHHVPGKKALLKQFCGLRHILYLIAGRQEIKADRVKHWMGHGAKLSDTVHNWLIDKKVIPGKKVNALPKKKPIAKEGEKKAEGAAPAAAEAPKA